MSGVWTSLLAEDESPNKTCPRCCIALACRRSYYFQWSLATKMSPTDVEAKPSRALVYTYPLARKVAGFLEPEKGGCLRSSVAPACPAYYFRRSPGTKMAPADAEAKPSQPYL
ncbi:hypothetical protein [Plasmodium yoelii yoelii]|uniref:Uncharacterized protein n=1 Tax=Plasmodium yoelii yoelii TaxID=73239 RepID=Q7R7K5_PLAYO|nr:hypothetical protein [Plasmodium yoelii yoelii]